MWKYPNEILYVYITDEEIELSDYCGYDKRVLNHLEDLNLIFKLPSDLTKLGRTKINKAKIASLKKLHTCHNIHICHINALESLPSSQMDNKFVVIIYSEQFFNRIENIINKWIEKPIMLCINDILDAEEILLKQFKEKLQNGLSKKKLEDLLVTESCNELLISNFSINPIINNLENYGLKFSNILKNYSEANNEPYIQNILEANRIMKQWCRNNGIYNSIDMIITSVPIIPKDFQKFVLKQSSEKNKLKSIFNTINYYNQCDDIVRKKELLCYEFTLQLLLEKYFAELYVIGVNAQQSINMEIKNLLSSNVMKMDKVYNSYLESVTKLFPEEILKRIPTEKISKLKFYTDLPLEFALDKYNGLPLILSSTITKVPTTPGMDAFISITENQDTYIHVNELSEILVIRSFKDDDPLKYQFENAYKLCQQELPPCISNNKIKLLDIKLIFRDVSSINEMICILNHQKYEMVIFDCHGYKGSDELHKGALIIGNEFFNPRIDSVKFSSQFRI